METYDRRARARLKSATRAYIVKPGGMPEAIPGQFNQPNGITLSKNQDVLYIGGNQLRKYPVMPDGTLILHISLGGRFKGGRCQGRASRTQAWCRCRASASRRLRRTRGAELT